MMYITGSAGSGSPLLTLLKKVPEWQQVLSKLNESMDNRQTELAEAMAHRRPNVSLKRMGSCESLRPNDDPGLGHTAEAGDDSDVNMVETTTVGNGEKAPPRLLRNSTSPGPIRNHSNRCLAAAGISKRNTPVLRKRKTESINSVVGDADQARQDRTRRNIQVFYDSRVQTAFSEMHNSIAQTRNALRKGKMARRMIGLNGSGRRASVLDMHRYQSKSLRAAVTNGASAGADFDADMDLKADGLLPDLEAGPVTTTNGTETPPLEADMVLEADDLPDLEADPTPTSAPAKDDGLPDLLEADDALQPDDARPPLQYRSTRLMNPDITTTAFTRTLLARHEQSKPTYSSSGFLDRHLTSRISSYSDGKKDDEPKDVFDDLDAGLEAASKICEDAAHQFLKWGCCRLEIERVEATLKTVKDRAEKGLEECPDMKEDSKPVPSPPYSCQGDLMDGLGDLEADSDLGELEVDDGLGELEVDDGLGELEVDPTSESVKPMKPAETPLSKKEAQFITVIRPDTAMDCSKPLKVDVTSISVNLADEVFTPIDDITQQKKRNMEDLNSRDFLAKYRGKLSSRPIGVNPR